MKKSTTIILGLALVLALGAIVFGPAASSFAQQDDPTTHGQPIQTTQTTSSNIDAQDAIDVVFSANWSDNVSISVNQDTITFSSDGVPNHEVGTYPRPGGEATVDPYNLAITMPVEPVLADEPTTTNMGPIGIAISGAAFYNPYDGGGVFAIGTVDLDACNAHPSPQNHYHYHGVPYCITDELDTDGQHSVLIGYLMDGFPIYGPQDANGEVPTDLDTCNGHFGPTPEYPEGIYHYHTTETASYVPECYSGVVNITAPSGAVQDNETGGQQPASNTIDNGTAPTNDEQQPAGPSNDNRPPRRRP